MRISLNWLSEYVDLPAPEELARKLTAVGLEVEAIERTGTGLGGVVAARILSSEKHPNAEKLSVTRVDAGKGEPLQIVCGAKNYQVGDVVPLATGRHPRSPAARRSRRRSSAASSPSGCSAPRASSASRRRRAACSSSTGPRRPGTPIAKALALEDVLLEVNVTPNRPDALSHVGIAREVAAALGAKVRMPAPKLPEAGAPAGDAVKVRIEAPERCARYAARVIEGVKIGPSPLWLARRLEACGVRSISNVVDATNFVLLELGHPLHAFDLDKVAGREIVVRTARPGEKLVTLDGKERALSTEDLLIADRDRGSALAGVMGGGDSEISAGTTRVLLESAWFQPSGIRRTSRRHGLKTEASYRFERGADPGMVIPAVDRCAALIAELAGGTVRPGIVDCHPRQVRAPEVRLRWRRPAEVLGMEIAPGRRAHASSPASASPSRRATPRGRPGRSRRWRADVSIEEDLVEEIVRTKGYDAIPETLPPRRERHARRARRGAGGRPRSAPRWRRPGFAEAVNFSFVAERELAPFEYQVVTGDGTGRALGIALKNPISADLSVMRTSLVPSLLRNVVAQPPPADRGVRLYEIASTYHPRSEPEGSPVGRVGRGRGRHPRPPQPGGLGGGRRRRSTSTTPRRRSRACSRRSASRSAGSRRASTWLHPRHSAQLLAASDDVVLGVVGELHPRVAAAFELPRGRPRLPALPRRAPPRRAPRPAAPAPPALPGGAPRSRGGRRRRCRGGGGRGPRCGRSRSSRP